MLPQSNYDVVFYIGRFQPFHKGHKSIVEKAVRELNPQKFVFLVGSTNKTNTPKNPLPYDKVIDLIKKSCEGASWSSASSTCRYSYHPLMDYVYDDISWIEQVNKIVEQYMFSGTRLALVGHFKDDSSYYLKKFPNLDLITYDNHEDISASTIRHELYSGTYNDSAFDTINRLMPPATHDAMLTWVKTSAFSRLKNEYITNAQYDPTIYDNTIVVTGDAVVYCDGHILVVKRGVNPGKGKLALPGGFIDKKERVVDAIFRELKEETRIDVPIGKLRNSLCGIDFFDDVGRSERARTITFAGFIDLRGEINLPAVKGSDDAASAMWISLSEFFGLAKTGMVHEDHADIVRVLANRYYR